MLSNLLVRDTPDPIPLQKNPQAHPLIQFIQANKQRFWDVIVGQSYGNRIVCGLRYFNPRRKEPPWNLLVQEQKLFQFYYDQLSGSAQRLEEGFLILKNAFSRFGFRALDRVGSFRALYELVNFAKAPEIHGERSGWRVFHPHN